MKVNKIVDSVENLIALKKTLAPKLEQALAQENRGKFRPILRTLSYSVSENAEAAIKFDAKERHYLDMCIARYMVAIGRMALLSIDNDIQAAASEGRSELQRLINEIDRAAKPASPALQVEFRQLEGNA